MIDDKVDIDSRVQTSRQEMIEELDTMGEVRLLDTLLMPFR
jgi:hypothetical protein